MRDALAFAVLVSTLAMAGGGCGDGSDPDSQGAAGQERGPLAKLCAEVDPAPVFSDQRRARPSRRLDPSKRYHVVLRTSCGRLTIQLDVKRSPNATASFVALSNSHFFDDTGVHRVVPGKLIEAGDPLGDGTGGPGYTTVDRPPDGVRYTRGTVAMARRAGEPPGAAGSRFFVVTAADAELPPEYALLGKVVDGFETLRGMDALGDPDGSGRPSRPIIIDESPVTVGRPGDPLPL